MGKTHLLPLTKNFFCFFEKATAPTAPIWPTPTPTQHLLSDSHSLTYIENGIRNIETYGILHKTYNIEHTNHLREKREEWRECMHCPIINEETK